MSPEKKSYRLKPFHPASLAFEAMCDKMAEASVSITRNGNGPLVFWHGKQGYEVTDMDTSEWVDQIPPLCEYKLVFRQD